MLNLYRSLHGRRDWQGKASRRRVMMAKYLARVLSMPHAHGRYLAFIQADPAMRAYRCRDPRILERHFHRYVNTQWNRPARLRSIRHHYQFALARLPAWLFKAIYVDGHAALGNLTLKDGSVVKLCLQPPIPPGCEGALCIQLSNLQDHPIYRVVLSVIDSGYRPHRRICRLANQSSTGS